MCTYMYVYIVCVHMFFSLCSPHTCIDDAKTANYVLVIEYIFPQHTLDGFISLELMKKQGEERR